MILRYEYLRRHPAAFRKLTGLDVARFEALLGEVLPRYDEAERQRRSRAQRQRAIGGGDHSDLDVCDQALLTLIWFHLYPKQQVLADFFGVSQPTVWRYIQRIAPLLDQMGTSLTPSPDPGRKQRRTLADLLCDVPELLPMIADMIHYVVHYAPPQGDSVS